MKLEIINVGNGTKEYPGNFTKKELKIIKYNSKGRIINLFSGNSKFGLFRIDFTNSNATNNIDVFQWLESLTNGFRNYYQQTIIIDAPYNQRFGDKYQKIGNTSKQFIIFANTKDTTKLFELIGEKINPNIIIIKSWNYYIPKGYKLKNGYLCYPGGYRKSTLLLILEKDQQYRSDKKW